MSLTLYSAPMSSATPVAHAFAELALPHEQVLLDLAEGKQRERDFLALNPNGKVPTLVVDGTPMFEALAILQWLGDTHGVARGLWPAMGDPKRLEALSWTTWSYVTYGSALTRLVLARSDRAPAGLRSEAWAEHAEQQLRELLGILDARLAERPYLLGDDYTLVDLVVGGVVGYSTFVGASVDPHPNVAAWLARYRARPSYQHIWASR